MAETQRAVGRRIALLIVDSPTHTKRQALLGRVPDAVSEQLAEVLVYPGATRGESQARGFRHAVDRGYDVVAVLRADGQDAPEALPELLAAFESEAADAVFGVRAPTPGLSFVDATKQRLFSRFENAMLGTSFDEPNPRYRLYSCTALDRVPFEKNNRDARFDAQIVIQLRGAGFRIAVRRLPPVERAALRPTSLKYATGLVRSVVDYELHEFGLRHAPEYVVPPAHTMKRSPLSSHSQLLALVGAAPRRILDVGCGQGELGHVLKQRGHHVVGVDWSPPRFELNAFVQADVAQGLPSLIAGEFDVILLADVLEHMAEPLKLLEDAKSRLAPGGTLLVSLPNVAHWSMRAQLAVGRFDYTNKGLLDRGHLRFFTHASAMRLFADAALVVVSRRTTPVPWENVLPRALGSGLRDKAEHADYWLTRLRPNLFAYQNLFELRLHDGEQFRSSR